MRAKSLSLVALMTSVGCVTGCGGKTVNSVGPLRGGTDQTTTCTSEDGAVAELFGLSSVMNVGSSPVAVNGIHLTGTTNIRLVAGFLMPQTVAGYATGSLYPHVAQALKDLGWSQRKLIGLSPITVGLSTLTPPDDVIVAVRPIDTSKPATFKSASISYESAGKLYMLDMHGGGQLALSPCR